MERSEAELSEDHRKYFIANAACSTAANTTLNI